MTFQDAAGRATNRAANFIDAARAYYENGWTAIPLGFDAEGRPKRPIPYGWQNTPHDWDVIKAYPWGRAKGLGLVLGAPSNGLAAIDVDDCGLAAWLFAYLIRNHRYYRMVWTIRGRLHIFVQEWEPSPSRAFTVHWQGRDFKVELKATGTQVASVPTKGYTMACDRPPMAAHSLIAAWAPLVEAAGIEERAKEETEYPRPWNERVMSGDRNNTAYVEAHRLREARMPLNQALELMHSRWEQSYEPGETSWREIERTIKSAYAKGLPKGQEIHELWAI